MPLRTLYPPDGDASDHCKVDIIAVHGLNPRNKDDEDHAWDTWRSPAGPDGHLWLRDDLPEHVPEARILLYRYEATAVYGTDRDTFVGKANELLEEIRVERGDIKTRPIIFIGHSMGGLLIKQSLINAHNNPKYTAIKDATSGLAFFATPHKGVDSNLRSLGELIARIAKHAGFTHGDSILEVLREGGIFNDVMQEHWRHQLLQYDIISFWGASDDIVEKENARLGMPGDRENLVKLHAGHGRVCRFGASQIDRDNLKLVRGNIKDIYGNAIKIYDVTMKDDLDADRHLRYYYSDQRLKIERLSGKRLSIAHCYINLAIIKTEPKKPSGPSEGDPSAATGSSPFELSSRLKIRQPEQNAQVNLQQLFDSRQDYDNHAKVVKRVLIRGRAGVGKTTLCKKIVFDFQHQNLWKNLFDRVLWVPLRWLKNWTSKIFNFRNFLHHLYFVHDEQNGHILAEHLEKMIGFNKRTDYTGKTLFILDGLDEVSAEWNPGDPKHDLLINLLDQPSVIITSRPHAQIPHHAENPIDLEVETIGFYPDQVKNYLAMAFQNSDKVTKAQATLDEFPLIQGLIRIPILLDAFTYIWESRLTLESGRMLQTMTSFYRLIVEELFKKDVVQLQTNRRRQKMTEAMARRELPCALEEAIQEPLFLLEELAFMGMSEDIIEFDPHIRNTVLRTSKSLKDASLLDQALQCTSFLRTSNLSQDGKYVSYHFLHLTFQEFFAARYFVRQWTSTGRRTCLRLSNTTAEGMDNGPLILSDFVARYKYEPRLDIFWRFVAGLLEVEGPEVITQFFQMLQDLQRDLLGPAHQRLIMHCLSEVSSQMSLRQELEAELEKWLILEAKLTHRSKLSREMEFPIRILDKVLKEGGATTATILVNLSHRFSMPNQILEVIMSLLQDDDFGVRVAAVKALSSQASNHQVQQALLGRLQDDDSDVREAAAEALSSQASDQQVQQALLGRLQDDHYNVRRAAVKALSSQTPDHQVQQALLGRLQDDDFYVRRIIVKALSSQASDQQVQHALLGCLQDNDCDVREAAVEALSSQVSNHQMQQALLGQLQDTYYHIRRAAVEVLSSQASDQQVQQALLGQLQDTCSNVREAAAEALSSQASDHQVQQALLGRLQDTRSNVRKAATEALSSQASDHQVQQALLGQLQDTHSNIRRAAVKALSSQASDQQVQQALLGRLQDNNSDVREAAAEALSSQAFNHQVQQALLGRLQDTYYNVRRAAVKVLSSQASNHQVQQALLGRLQDDYSNVRRAAVKVLSSQVSNHQVQQALLGRLQDDDSDVREAAAEALSSQASDHQMQQALLGRLQYSRYSATWVSDKAFLHQLNNARHLVDKKYLLPLYLVLLQNSFDYHLSWQAQSSRFYLITPWGDQKLHVSNVSRSIIQFRQIREAYFLVENDTTKNVHFQEIVLRFKQPVLFKTIQQAKLSRRHLDELARLGRWY